MTPSQWQQKAVLEVGDTGNSAVFEITLPMATTSGSWLIAANGIPTEPLDPFISADALEVALETISTIGVGNIHVSGLPLGPFTLQLMGELSGQEVPDGWLVASGVSLIPVGSVTVVRTKQGRTETLSQLAAQYWEMYAGTPDYVRHLKVKLELLKVEIGRAVKLVDGKDGDAEAKESQRFANLLKLKKDTETDLAGFQTEAVSTGGGQVISEKIEVGQNAIDNFHLRRFYGRSTLPFR
jgi:hypothetical protein